jgi:hypothetical protein
VNHQPRTLAPRELNPDYTRAFLALDEILGHKTKHPFEIKIAAIRQAVFADVDEFVASGRLAAILPPPKDP